jgi:hypothetical protein
MSWEVGDLGSWRVEKYLAQKFSLWPVQMFTETFKCPLACSPIKTSISVFFLKIKLAVYTQVSPSNIYEETNSYV